MKIRDFIKKEIDIDVYDDLTEELGIAFCGPLELTEEGKKKFEKVLDMDIEPKIQGSYPFAIVHIPDGDDVSEEQLLEEAKEFFESAAGLCTCSEYNKWFKEINEADDFEDSKPTEDFCPFCHSQDITLVDKYIELEATERFKCNSCGKWWEDIYELTFKSKTAIENNTECKED